MNPFFSVSDIDGSEYLSSRCSLNRAVLRKLPVRGIDDSIEGLRFSEILSTPLVIEELERQSAFFGVRLSEEDESPRFLDRALVSENIRERLMAEKVAEKFGNRLGLMLLTLRRADSENRLAREDWDDSCWDYWRNLSTVILTGGLSSSMLGRRFKERIQFVFDYAGERPYNIMLFDNGAYLGIMGVAQRLMRDDSVSMVFDFGQTNLKRAVVKKENGIVSSFSPMESLPSMHMRNRFDREQEQLAEAINLHRFLVNTIVSSCREASSAHALSDEIFISIANYTHSGVLDGTRGGYAKLRLLSANYAQLLVEEISSELHRPVRVRMVHDGTATALYFSDIENSVCVTLGTGFGVGFPDIRL